MKKLSQTDIESATAAITSCIIFGILATMPRLSSLLFVASITRYDVDREKASFPFILSYTLRMACGPLIGYIGGRFGLKNAIVIGCLMSFFAIGGCFFAENILTITILWGAFYGLGYGLGVALIPQVLSMHFSSHLDKAVGITMATECVVSFFLILLTKFLLSTYGLSGTFLILSGLVLHSVVAAFFIQIPNQHVGQIKIQSTDCVSKYDRNDTKEINVIFSRELDQTTNQDQCKGNNIQMTDTFSRKPNSEQRSSFYGFRVFLNPTFILIILTQSSLAYVFTSINTILVDVIRDHEVPLDESVYVLACFQVADAIGRSTLGFFTDRGYLSKANFSALCFFAMSSLLIAFIWIKGFVGMIIFIIVFGVLVGGLVMISPVFVIQYVGKDYLSIAIPSRLLLHAPISFTQAPLIGFFRDKLKSYDGLLCILIAICCVSGILSLIVPFVERCRQRKKNCSQKDKSIVH